MSERRMLSTRDVARRLNLHRDTVSRNAAKIPGAHKVFGRWRFDPAVFESWLESRQEVVDTWAAPKRGAMT